MLNREFARLSLAAFFGYYRSSLIFLCGGNAWLPGPRKAQIKCDESVNGNRK